MGWLNDCLEKLVIDKFGVETWHAVKQASGCDVKDNGFLKLENYHDESTVVLVESISELTGLSIEEVYQFFGAYFVYYSMHEGFENLLFCQGRTLKEWMAGINAVHGHLQTAFPNKMAVPEFWCEENADGTLALFYSSSRGSYLVPFAEGLITEVAKLHFELDITMTLMSTQGEAGARFTSWIVATENPDDLWRLRFATAAGERVDPTSIKCPMSGMVINASFNPDAVDTATLDTMSVTEYSLADSSNGKAQRRARNSKKSCPFSGSHSRNGGSKMSNSSNHSKGSASGDELSGDRDAAFERGSLSSLTTRKLFPYHIVIDQDFSIVQVGSNLSRVLGTKESILYNSDVDEVFTFAQPKQAKWTRSWMRKLEDQEFTLSSLLDSPPNLLFKGTLVATNPGEAMLVLCPQADNLEDLRQMNLTMTDLPAHGAYRDAIFLREHLSKQLNNALKMEKLSKTLQTEKELLESLLPVHAAEGLRKGQVVKPRMHFNVTLFFSDVVGFTTICRQVDPTEVVDMLNRLYMVMDYLAKKFNLFKIETIGDAYVAASGLPDSDDKHSVNVANFAVAVTHCCRRVLSPLDGTPIRLRIGINSGRCASGIVGVTNPRYCVFGDTVNTTARHESTGEAGRVHCSMTTMIELLKSAPDDFVHESRGLVEMKGKGAIPTYWLTSTKDNLLTNKESLKALDAEIMEKFKDTLRQEDCIARRKAKKKAPTKEDDDDAPPATLVPVETPTVARAQQDDQSDDESNDDFDSSATSFNSSMPSPLGFHSRRSSYVPSKNELLQMLGNFLDGEDYDAIITSNQGGLGSESTLPLTDVVDEALRIIDYDA